MSDVASAGVVTSTLPSLVPATSSAATTTAPQTSMSFASQPADTVSISGNAAISTAAATTASAGHPITISASVEQVSTALEVAGQVQALTFEYNHVNWDGFYQKWGEQGVKNLQAGLISEINSSNNLATEMGIQVGIPIQSNLTLPTESNGSVSDSPMISGGITVSPFNFNSDGSAYAVTTNTAGQLVGTKNGQAWQTWGVSANDIPSTTDELVSLLALFKVKDAAANSSGAAVGSADARLDISA